MNDGLRRRVPAVVAGALILLGVLAVSSYAGHQTAVASLTGCLKPSQGTLSRFALGNSPSSPCPVDNVVVHVSGGDITSVDAGVGLSGSSANGAASLNVEFADFGACAAGSAIRTIGATATCEADDDTTYSAGSGLSLGGTTFSADTSVVQARVSGACAVGAAIRAINADGTVVCESSPPASAGGGELILIQRHEFDAQKAWFGTSTDWEVTETGGATTMLDPEYEPGYVSTSALTLDTNPSALSSVVVRGKRQASVGGGTLVFKTHVLDAYAEAFTAYGNKQPRGLVNGSDRNNAIELTNGVGFQSGGLNTTAICRTVKDGSATETMVNIDQWVRAPAVYQIIATPSEVKFYVNGVLECTHTTDIPTVPLNVYFATSNNGFGHIPLSVDWMSYEQRES